MNYNQCPLRHDLSSSRRCPMSFLVKSCGFMNKIRMRNNTQTLFGLCFFLYLKALKAFSVVVTYPKTKENERKAQENK